MTSLPHLDTPLTLREVELRNRLGLPAMSQYRADAYGRPTADWHLPHYLTRAIGLGLVVVEATAVAPEARVTPHDLGLWNDEQIAAFAHLTALIRAQGAVPALQLSHAGRKASRTRPSDGDAPLADADGGWQPLAPSPLPFGHGQRTPRQMTPAHIDRAVGQFADAARRAHHAGFRLLELHAGHGRLLHSYLSPHANRRTDAYGGSFQGRTRLLRETVRAVRTTWPAELPLAVRLSCTDHHTGGWTLEDSVRLAPLLADDGADLIDCTSGGIARPERRPTGLAWQAPYARALRTHPHLVTAAVGHITTLGQAEGLLRDGDCDLVLMGRQLLADPMLPARAMPGATVPAPYQRALTTVGAQHGADAHLAPEL